MKKIISYTGITVLLFTFTAGRGQEKRPNANHSVKQQVFNQDSGIVNPAKISQHTVIDSKMNPALLRTGPVNWKPAVRPSDGKKDMKQGRDLPDPESAKAGAAVHRPQPAPKKPER